MKEDTALLLVQYMPMWAQAQNYASIDYKARKSS